MLLLSIFDISNFSYNDLFPTKKYESDNSMDHCLAYDLKLIEEKRKEAKDREKLLRENAKKQQDKIANKSPRNIGSSQENNLYRGEYDKILSTPKVFTDSNTQSTFTNTFPNQNFYNIHNMTAGKVSSQQLSMNTVIRVDSPAISTKDDNSKNDAKRKGKDFKQNLKEISQPSNFSKSPGDLNQMSQFVQPKYTENKIMKGMNNDDDVNFILANNNFNQNQVMYGNQGMQNQMNMNNTMNPLMANKRIPTQLPPKMKENINKGLRKKYIKAASLYPFSIGDIMKGKVILQEESKKLIHQQNNRRRNRKSNHHQEIPQLKKYSENWKISKTQ